MEDIQSKPITLSHPKDTSLAAYKAWMLELCKRFTTKEICIVLSEEEWIASWQAYWKEQPGG
jgi:hypothetical protein